MGLHIAFCAFWNSSQCSGVPIYWIRMTLNSFTFCYWVMCKRSQSCSSLKQECIPVGCVLPALVVATKKSVTTGSGGIPPTLEENPSGWRPLPRGQRLYLRENPLPQPLWTDRHLRKHYLLAHLFAGGNKTFIFYIHLWSNFNIKFTVIADKRKDALQFNPTPS